MPGRALHEDAADAAIGLDELRARARSPFAEPASPFGPDPYVLLRLDGESGSVGAEEAARCAHWLRRQCCPVIAIAPSRDAHPALQRACDVVVGDAAEAPTLLQNVRHAPLAAMTLVQVLRATEHMPIEHALHVESLAYATLQGGPEFRRWLHERGPARSAASADPTPAVLMERSGNRVDIRLNRPSRRNALSVEMREALCDALQLVAADDTIVTAHVSGNGPGFCSGGDLDEFGSAPDTATAHAVRSLRLPASVLLRCVERVEFTVHGACIGAGAELPAFAPRVRARADAYFQLPELRFGLIPGAGGCVSLPRRIGRQRTAYMGLSAARVDARQAHAWGLVDELRE